MENKYTPHQITVPEMAPHIHSFLFGENKVNKLTKWLVEWIDFALESGKANPYDYLPSKAELACHIGVSQGTMQNVFRQVEDMGYLESKQRVGTFIKDRNKGNSLKKLTSKREHAISVIKKYIRENNYQNGDILISTRKLAKITGISVATLRLAIANLVSCGILNKKERNFIITNNRFKTTEVEAKTLVDKVSNDIESYIKGKLKDGGKLPSNTELAKALNVSVKTIHDAIKHLSKKGILYSRRGRYGTIVLTNENNKEEPYFYEKVEHKIRHYISAECKVGDKLPSILEFSKKFNVSPKTIKKALDNLSEDGFLTFARGRYGGTFVTDIPQSSKEAYTWLALNSEYITSIEN